jgi:L-amino acid N-acyltransferase YncA
VYKNIIDDEYINSLRPEDQANRMTHPKKGYLVSKKPQIAVFVAEENNQIIGWSSVGPSREKAYQGYAELYAIYLDPDFIGRGIGKALFNKAIDHLKEYEFRKMFVDVLDQTN